MSRVASRSPPYAPLSVAALGAGAVGNLLEWYDFGLYGLLAPVLAPLFFPSIDPVAALIGAYGGFALGFMMRPLGGAVLGNLGDRIGRGTGLVLSVVRMAQGFSVGGEFTGSVTYLVETAPPGRRGFAGSFANLGSTGGVLLAAAMAAVTVTLADGESLRWA